MDNAGVQKEHRDHTRLYTLGPCTHVKIEMHSHEQHGLAIVFNQLLNPACAIIFTITTGHGSLSLSKSGFPTPNGSSQHPTQPDHILAARLPAGVVQIPYIYIGRLIMHRMCKKMHPRNSSRRSETLVPSLRSIFNSVTYFASWE